MVSKKFRSDRRGDCSSPQAPAGLEASASKAGHEFAGVPCGITASSTHPPPSSKTTDCGSSAANQASKQAGDAGTMAPVLRPPRPSVVSRSAARRPRGRVAAWTAASASKRSGRSETGRVCAAALKKRQGVLAAARPLVAARRELPMTMPGLGAKHSLQTVPAGGPRQTCAPHYRIRKVRRAAINGE